MKVRASWWRRFGGVAGLAGLVACASPGSQRIVGPDGSPMAHVHCGSDQGSCFRLAGELCPGGYDIKPVLSGNDGNFLVRCHAAATLPAVAALPPAAPPPPPTVGVAPAAVAPAATSSRSAERWPPSNEPWPAAYPWPPPESSAAVQSQPAAPRAPNAPSNTGDLNLGF
jgi:hypothetical protein